MELNQYLILTKNVLFRLSYRGYALSAMISGYYPLIIAMSPM